MRARGACLNSNWSAKRLVDMKARRKLVDERAKRVLEIRKWSCPPVRTHTHTHNGGQTRGRSAGGRTAHEHTDTRTHGDTHGERRAEFFQCYSQNLKNMFQIEFIFYSEARTSALRSILNRRAAGGIVFNVILRI